jgi:hypothetical protein
VNSNFYQPVERNSSQGSKIGVNQTSAHQNRDLLDFYPPGSGGRSGRSDNHPLPPSYIPQVVPQNNFNSNSS